MKYDWDATTYDRISDAQESWGQEIIKYRKWKGNEIVLDAGCSSGRTTRILSKVPQGKVIAVDSDLSMIKVANENLAKFSNIEFIKMDISEIELEEKVDVVFSNATLHWILNHKKVFERLWQILKSEGQLLIQCGGHRDLAKTLSIFNTVSKSKEFYNYFYNNNKGEDIWKQTWYFAKKEDTEKILQKIGFRNIKVFLEDREAKFTNKEEFFIFIKTIVLIPYLKHLPNDMLKDKFAKSVVEEIETNAKELQWKLDYVRLNINAIK